MLQEAVNASRNRQGDVLELTCNGLVCFESCSTLHSADYMPCTSHFTKCTHEHTCQPVILSIACSNLTSTVCSIPLFVIGIRACLIDVMLCQTDLSDAAGLTRFGC